MADQISLRRETNLYDDETIKAVNNKVTSQYAVSTTSSSTVAKTATVDGAFTLFKNARVSVFFQNANTSTSPTLNVAGTGAKPIWAYGGPLSATGNTFNWVANSTIEFVYDGEHWLVADSGAVGLISKYDEKLSQEVVFNKLTNNGEIRGIFMQNGQLYVNMDYLQTGTLKLGGVNNGNGELIAYDASGNIIGRLNKDGILSVTNGTISGVSFSYTLGFCNRFITVRQVGSTHGSTSYRFKGYIMGETDKWSNTTIDRDSPFVGLGFRSYVSDNYIIEEPRLEMCRQVPSYLDIPPTDESLPTYTDMSYNIQYMQKHLTGYGQKTITCRVKFGRTSYYQIADDGASKVYTIAFGSITKNNNRFPFLNINSFSYNTSPPYTILHLTAETNWELYIGGTKLAKVSSSSLRYKHSITDKIQQSLNPHCLYKLSMKQFTYNKDHTLQYADMEGQAIPGFIAEDVDEVYPVAVIHDEDGNIESWDERRIIPGMLALIQEQKKQLDEQAERIKKLENNTSFVHIM